MPDQFSAAAGISEQALAWILEFVAAFETTYGRYPTVAEVRKALISG